MTDIAGERARLAAQGLNIIIRETWGAQQSYTSDRTVNRPAQWLFLHITVTADPQDTLAAEYAACQQVEAIGQSRFGIGWSYNAGAMQSGRLYEGQPLTRRGAHTVNDKPNPNFPSGSLNYDARALAIVQNVEDAVTDPQIDAAARWGAALRRSGEAIAQARWYGHRDVTAKSCPGPIAYARLGELNALTDHYTKVGLGPVQPPEDDDMIPVIGVQNDPNRYYAALCDGYVRIFYGWDPGGLDSRTVWCSNDELDKGTDVLYKPLKWVAADVYDRLVASAKAAPPADLIPVFGVVGDATAYYMAPRDGYVQIFHQWDPDIDDPLVVWQPSEVYQACIGETYATVTYVDRATYDAIAASAKRRPETVAARGEGPGDR